MDFSIFDDNQKKVIQLPVRVSELSDILVVAGAGSGKTRVLINRITYLIEKNVPPAAILALTFTKKAAGEMRERLALNCPNASKVKMSTFHSLAADILRNHLPFQIEIIDEKDKSKLLKSAIQELELKDKVKIRDFDSWYSYQRNKCLDPYKEQEGDEELILDYRSIAKKYKKMKSEIGQGVFDFDDLLEQLLLALIKTPNLKSRLHSQWRFVLVDEYQDTNKLQFRILSHLRGPRTQLLQVGDEDQLIYSWRGAEIEYILKSYKNSIKDGNVESVILNTNYRCSGNILELANKVVGTNVHRTGKTLVANKKKGAAVSITEYNSCSDEADGVAQKIKEWDDEGIELKKIAVLMRTNAMSRQIERALIDRRIEYTLYNGVALFDSKEVRLLIALLRLTESPGETFYLAQVMEVIKMGVGEVSLKKLEKERISEGLDWFSFFESKTNMIAKERIKELVSVYYEAKNFLNDGQLEECARCWLHNMDLMRFFKESEREKKAEKLVTFFGVLEDYEHDTEVEKENLTVRGFQEARLLDNNVSEKSNGGVQIMTIHKSKGLEFSHGFIIGMQDGIFPKMPTNASGQINEEEFRLAYVSITRFMEKLHITKSFFRIGYDDISVYSSILDPHLSGLIGSGVVEQEDNW